MQWKLAPKKRQALLDTMRLDKKVNGGELAQFVLANAIGDVAPGQRVPDSDIQRRPEPDRGGVANLSR